MTNTEAPRVEVYWNLHRRTFSVRSCTTGRVIQHADTVHILNPEFVVRQAGRAKVLAEGRKNVHAFVRGTLSERQPGYAGLCKTVTYNPFKYSTFVSKDDESPIHEAEVAAMFGNGIFPRVYAIIGS